jgi:hypothetical protein
MTVPESAGSASTSLTVHQSLNKTQSPAYARTVAGDSGRLDAVTGLVMSQTNGGDGITNKGCVFPGVDLEHPG